MAKKIIKYKLFPFNGDNDIWNKVVIDDESVNYITTPHDAQKITKIIEKHCLKNAAELTITDATAGVGGNVLSFATRFKHVNAIELDAIRYGMLITNIAAYNYINVTSYCDSCINIMNEIYTDIIFIDPPWGGKDYKDKKNLRLSLSDISLEDICINSFNNTKINMICLKLPKNYDLEYLHKKISDVVNIKIYLHNLNKMNIVIVQRS